MPNNTMALITLETSVQGKGNDTSINTSLGVNKTY